MERIKLKSAQQISPMMAGKSGKIRLFESVYVGRGYPLCLLPIPGTSLRRKLLEIQDDTGNSGRTRHRSRSIFLRAFPTPWTGSGGGGGGEVRAILMVQLGHLLTLECGVAFHDILELGNVDTVFTFTASMLGIRGRHLFGFT